MLLTIFRQANQCILQFLQILPHFLILLSIYGIYTYKFTAQMYAKHYKTMQSMWCKPRRMTVWANATLYEYFTLHARQISETSHQFRKPRLQLWSNISIQRHLFSQSLLPTILHSTGIVIRKCVIEMLSKENKLRFFSRQLMSYYFPKTLDTRKRLWF